MKTIQTIEQPFAWAGFDLAKLTLEVGIWGHESFPSMRTRTFKRTRKEMEKVLAWLREEAPAGRPLAIVMEATGKFAEEVAGWLLDLDPAMHVSIVNPGQTHAFIRSLGFRNKTDNLDAKALSKYGQERHPAPWERPIPAMAALKDLVRTRADIVEARTAMTLRMKDHERTSQTATEALKAVIQTLAKQVEVLDEAIEEHLGKHRELGHQVKRFLSIKGVGIVTAVTVLVELGDLRRFHRSRQLTAFAGVSPRMKQSGTSVNGRAHLCKQGSARVRATLFMAATTASRFNPDLAASYQNLLAKGKEKRSALGAVMRKLLVLMRAVLKADRDWIPKAA